jgi:undecaprenyl-diphosphatase
MVKWVVASLLLCVVPAMAAEEETKRITLQEAAVLGVVEGMTEFLPVSSTGHLILASSLAGHSTVKTDAEGIAIQGPFGPIIGEPPAISAFNIIIQLGAILAVVGLYRARCKKMVLGAIGRSQDGRRLLFRLMAAFLPAALLGPLFDDKIENHLFSPLPVCIALAVGGVIMIVVEQYYRRHKTLLPAGIDLSQIRYRHALFIGMVQCLAMWPGTSRSMVTIIAGLLIGLNMVAAAEFSFLLALPTLGGATVYKMVQRWDVLDQAAGPLPLLVGLFVSWIVAMISMKLLVRWLGRYGLTPFGVYRIALAAVFFFLILR